ncbi:MAG TPA: calcium/proton exchanger [Chloroflexia bacterium]|nr:calcium/proton exchanger [Chloroflexia bacterium]
MTKAIYALLVFVPIVIVLHLLEVGGLWIFLSAAAAIIPLAKILSTATEKLSEKVGAGVGGLLSATFGNAVEMIIAFFALQAGLYEVVKASIAGSILGNVLFVLGLSMFVGGLGREKQEFNRTAAGAAATQLTLATVGLFIPAAFVLTTPPTLVTTELREELSLGVAGLLLLGYIAQLLFALRTHPHLYREEGPGHAGSTGWSRRHAALVLLGTTVLVAIVAELLVEGLEYLTATLHLSELFVGVVLVALVGGAAESVTAVTLARKNQMPLAVNIVMSSTLQIALFVAPVLVIGGFLTGRPLDLNFNVFEVAAIIMTMLIANTITHDGESTWFEGVQLLIAYALLAVAFFFHP